MNETGEQLDNTNSMKAVVKEYKFLSNASRDTRSTLLCLQKVLRHVDKTRSGSHAFSKTAHRLISLRASVHGKCDERRSFIRRIENSIQSLKMFLLVEITLFIAIGVFFGRTIASRRDDPSFADYLLSGVTTSLIYLSLVFYPYRFDSTVHDESYGPRMPSKKTSPKTHRETSGKDNNQKPTVVELATTHLDLIDSFCELGSLKRSIRRLKCREHGLMFISMSLLVVYLLLRSAFSIRNYLAVTNQQYKSDFDCQNLVIFPTLSFINGMFLYLITSEMIQFMF